MRHLRKTIRTGIRDSKSNHCCGTNIHMFAKSLGTKKQNLEYTLNENEWVWMRLGNRKGVFKPNKTIRSTGTAFWSWVWNKSVINILGRRNCQQASKNSCCDGKKEKRWNAGHRWSQYQKQGRMSKKKWSPMKKFTRRWWKDRGEAAEPWRKCTESTKWSEGRQSGETWRNHSNDIHIPTTKEKRLSLQTHQGRGSKTETASQCTRMS